ncbi:MAG: SDR family NAD(P)-dependent oxidoreductase, partial [Ignavibacteriales bacterium]
RVVQGEEKNMKRTNPTDIFVADKIFQLNSVHLNSFQNLSDLQGKVIVIYGHTGGIGKQINAIASALGAKTYGFSRSNGFNIEAYDNAEDSLAQVFGQEKSIDYVVNAAAIMQMGALAAKTVNEIREEISINYLGSINVVKASIDFLGLSKGSIALFTSSSYTRGRAFYSIYSSTKAAIVNFVQAMAEELIAKQIRINAINPERTATPMRLRNFGAEPAETLLTPEEVAYQTLQVLLSPLSGQIIDIRKTMNDLPGGDG